MDTSDNEAADAVTEDTSEDTFEETEQELSEDTDWKAEATKWKRTAISRARKLKAMEQTKVEPPAPKPDSKPEPAAPSQAGELDDTALELLELRGITEDEDLNLITSVMRKTGQSLRSALRDEYVVNRLAANKQKRENEAATPSSTKRSGQAQTNDLDYWLAENERSGKLPDDFDLRVKVIEAKEARYSDRTPPWLKR